MLEKPYRKKLQKVVTPMGIFSPDGKRPEDICKGSICLGEGGNCPATTTSFYLKLFLLKLYHGDVHRGLIFILLIVAGWHPTYHYQMM